LKREAMSALIGEIEKQHPEVRSVMLHAISNVRPTHLLDREVQAAWDARPASIRPRPAEPRITKRHAKALPVFAPDEPAATGPSEAQPPEPI
jgi:tRNA 2-thiocytidine biosynthesis protein TtcA